MPLTTNVRTEKIKSRLGNALLYISIMVCMLPIFIGPFYVMAACGKKVEYASEGFALINNFIDFFGNPSFTEWLPLGIFIYQISFFLMGILTFYDQLRTAEKVKKNKLNEDKIGNIRFESNWAFAMGFFALFLLVAPVLVIGPIAASTSQLTEAIALIFTQSSDESIVALSALLPAIKNLGLVVFFIAYDVLFFLISWIFNSITESSIILKMEIETLKKSCTESKEQM